MPEPQGYELELVFKLKYKADPYHYVSDDPSENITPYVCARIDAEAFANDPDAAFAKFLEDANTEITVAPIIRYEP